MILLISRLDLLEVNINRGERVSTIETIFSHPTSKFTFQAGPEKGKLLPDFLTVKVVPHHPDQPRDYRIITVIELKREEDDRIGAELQMTNYMRRINRICSPDDSFKGFLVSYDRVAVYSYSGPRSDNRRIDMVDEYSMFDAGDPWTRDLADIAIRHWN